MEKRSPPPSGERGEREAFDPALAAEALDLLRTWGYGMGMRKLKARVQRSRDGRKRSAFQALLDIVGGEVEARTAVEARLRPLACWPALRVWALVGEASAALRSRDCRRTHELLDEASASVGDDPPLRATLAHLRGSALGHEGKAEESLPHLHEALTLFGRAHFAAGRVLDSLGMAHAARGQFHVAREFYEQAVRHKEQAEDEPGLAVSHGQLGRLFLDWGRLDEAERHFQTDLRLAQNLLDQRGEAQMYNHLGQVALARAERDLAAGRKSGAARGAAEAAGWLDGAIRLAVECRNPITEGYARKDRALTHLLQGEIDRAEEEVRQADELFRVAGYADGTARVNRSRGVLLRMQERYDESTRRLRLALQFFEANAEPAEAALTLWELARTQRAAGARPPLLTRAYLEALGRAESCRRGELTRRIEDELREIDHEAHIRHLYERSRGAGFLDEADLDEGIAETATLLAVRLDGVSEATRDLEPAEALQTLNDLLADLETVLVRQRAVVLTYSGDGFLALCREARHAERAVRAALELAAALEELNRPRWVLGLPLWRARLAAATGPVVLGNVGTCRKTQPTALGQAVGEAGRLLSWAEPGRPCVNHDTYEATRGRFRWPEGPRPVPAVGSEPCEVWDVLGAE
jgi:class 3 adenylate cyclase